MHVRKKTTILQLSAFLCTTLLLSIPSAYPSSPFELDTREIEGKKQSGTHKPKKAKPRPKGDNRARKQPTPPQVGATRIRVVHIGGNGPIAIFDGIMDALQIKSEKGKLIEAYGDKARTQFYSISADRYFEENGRRYAVNCSGMDPYNYSLYRILELQGYQVIHIKEGESAGSVAITLLSRLGRPYRQGRHLIRSASDPRRQVELNGALIPSTGKSGEDLILTERGLTREEERWVKKGGVLAGR